MRGFASLLSAAVVLLGVTSALAQPPEPTRDTTPCGKVAPGPVSVPDDFSLSYRSGPTNASWGTTRTTTVYASGRATITDSGSKGRGGPRVETSTERTVSKQAVQSLYATVTACDFFALNESYFNRHVMDGSSSSLWATASGKKHHVVVHHYPVTRFYAVVSALNKAIENK